MLVAVCVLVGSATAAVLRPSVGRAQSPRPGYNMVETLEDFFETPAGEKLMSQFASGGPQVETDPVGDFTHSSGQQPGFKPPYIDLIGAVQTGKVMPGTDRQNYDLFFSSDRKGGPWCLSKGFGLSVDVRTFCSRDWDGTATAFRNGSLAVGIQVREPFPAKLPAAERCEAGLWTFTPGVGPPDQGNPQFPNDPAIGSNRGWVLSWDGRGNAQFFGVQTGPSGRLQTKPTNALAAMYADQVALFVPLDEVGSLTRIRYHTFCTETAGSFDPNFSGEDIMGPYPIDFAKLAVLILTALVSTPSPTETGLPTSSPASPGGVAETGEESNLRPLFWGLTIGGIILFLAGLICCLCCWWRRRRWDDDDEGDDEPRPPLAQ